MLRRCLWLICLLLWPIAASAEPGACGSSAGLTLTATPTTGLCSAGLASAVTGAGPWSWYCQGPATGDTAQLCSALKTGYHFVNWTGPGLTSTTNPLTVADAATAAQFKANFALDTNVVSVHGLADLIDFRGGASHSVVLKGNHQVVAWGGSEGQSNIPVGLTGKAIDAGVYHTLVVKDNGTVGAYGSYVHPVNPEDPIAQNIPVFVPGFLAAPGASVGAVAVAGGYSHSIALMSDGTVVAWGDNSYGQTNVPAGLNGVVAIAAGHHHNLALKDDGTIVAWGRYFEFQTTIPAQLTGAKVVAIAAKAYHSVALTSDGKVFAWGANELGQGNVPSAAMSGVKAIAAGGHHTVALKNDGTILAWGDTKFGQSLIPTGVTGITAIAAGTYHTYALKGNLALIAWGQNQSGQCNVPASAYLPVAHGTVNCFPIFVEYGKDSVCSIGAEMAYGLSDFVVNGISQKVTTDTAVLSAVKTYTSVTAAFSQGAQVTAFVVPDISKSTSVPVLTFTATGMGAIIGYKITMTATTPSAGWSPTAPTTYNVGTPGVHTLYAWAKDAAGNISTAKTHTVNVDNLAPVISTFTVQSPVNKFTAPITALAVADPTGVTGYMVKDSIATPDATGTGWSATPPTSYTFASTGSKTLYAWAKDGAGNVSLAKTATVNVDMTAPDVTAFAVKSPTNSLTVAVTTFTASDNTAVAGYLLTENSVTPLAGDDRWSATKPTSYTFTTPGDKLLYAWAKDSAGNVSSPSTALVVIDSILPQVTAFVAPPVVRTLNIPITTFTASDNNTVTGYMITLTPAKPTAGTWSATPPTSFTVSAPGVKTLYAWAKDAVGNISDAKTATVNFDMTPPVVTFTASTPSNTLTVPVTVTATDSGGIAGYIVKDTSTPPLASDPAWTAAPPASFTLAAPGAKTLYAWAKDQMGNVSIAKSVLVSIDTTPPTVTAFTVKSPAGFQVPITAFAGIDNTAVGGYLVTETAGTPLATDPGWKTVKPAFYTATTSGDKTLYGWIKDTAGNISAAKTATTSVDAVPPVVTAFVVPAVTKTLSIPITTFTATDDRTLAGYQITLTATPPVATSAWKATAPTSFMAPSPGVKTLYAWAKDWVGNVSLAKTATVNVDMTPPVVTFKPQSPSKTLDVALNLSATDVGGVAGYMVKDTAIAPLASADGWSATPPATYTLAAPGTKTLYAWAKDQIGNVSVAKSAIITIDTTPPNITTFTVKTPAGMNVPITAFVATDNIGIGGYLVTETPATPAENDPGWTATKPAIYLATTSGVKTLYGWVKDKAGNISTSVTATATVDAVPPVVTAFVVPTMAKAIVPITTFTATDNNGVTGYMITTTPTVPLATAPTWKPTAPTTFSAGTPGVKTLYAWAKDAVGNVSAASTATVTVDMVVPVITSFKVQTPSNSLTVNITDLTATDSNGVTGYLVKNTATPPLATAADWSAAAPATYTFATPGVKILYAWAKDAAGNVSMVKTAQVAITVPAP